MLEMGGIPPALDPGDARVRLLRLLPIALGVAGKISGNPPVVLWGCMSGKSVA